MTTKTTDYENDQPITRMTSRETPVTGSLQTGIVGREDMYAHKSKYIGRDEMPSDYPSAEYYKDGGMTIGRY